jgi:uroporphyrinogen-III synthase
MRVLVTRPQPDAARTAARVRELGHDVIVDSLLSITPSTVSEIPAGPFAALAVTSANAARAAAANVALDFARGIPTFTVGGHTAEAARAAGFKKVVAADGDASALARLLQTQLDPGTRVLHLAGEDRARDLSGLLSNSGIAVDVIVLYRAQPAATLAPAVVTALSQNRVDAVLHYSLRSAATFASLAQRQGLADAARRPRHLCLSRTVAQGLAPLGVAVECAVRPNEDELVALLGP